MKKFEKKFEEAIEVTVVEIAWNRDDFKAVNEVIIDEEEGKIYLMVGDFPAYFVWYSYEDAEHLSFIFSSRRKQWFEKKYFSK